MSVSLLNKLSPSEKALLAALLQDSNNSEAVVDEQPEDAPSERRTIPKEWPVGWEIIRLLNSKLFNADEPVVSSEGATIEAEDGSLVTFGDLATVVEGGAVSRKTGKPVNDYPMVWSLTWPEAKGARDWLRSKTDKPKAAPKGQSRKSGSQPKAESGELKAVMAALAAMQAEIADLKQPAKPVPSAGHKKIAQPAKPVADDLIELAEGQIVAFGDELWQITVHASGKPAFRKTIV